jgi:hypothetical protein
MQLSSLSTSSYSTPNGRYKERRASVGAATSSVHFPVESRDIPATFEVSAAGVNNVSYIYKPLADLLGLIADAEAGAFGGSLDAPNSPDFLGDLSWLFSPRGASDAAAPAASASAGSGIRPFSSVLAANAAYESSMHLADEEMDASDQT